MPGRGTPRRPLAVDFGDRTWNDVLAKLTKWAASKYIRVDQDILEDALQDAIVAGMTYWQTRGTSHSEDTQKNFDFAVSNGKRDVARALQALYLQRMENPTSDDEAMFAVADPAPGPDVLAEDSDLQERARAMLGDMSPSDLEEFFTYFGDETNDQAAKRLGVTSRTVQNRRVASRRVLRHKSRRYGIA